MFQHFGRGILLGILSMHWLAGSLFAFDVSAWFDPYSIALWNEYRGGSTQYKWCDSV
jgi:hypothetical protein